MDNPLIKSIFKSQHIHLAGIDPEKDAPIEATWMTDQAYAEDRISPPARPLSEHEILIKLQNEIKTAQDSNSEMLFAYRANLDDHLVGFLRFHNILWNQRAGQMKILFGGREKLERLGREFITLACTFAFHEMNLHRLTVFYPEYRQTEMDLFHREGFRDEVRRREAHFYHGKYWDVVHLGLLKSDWNEVGKNRNDGNI
jgi:RimJ/RimL family protein N-acetyltransferase